MELDIQRKKDLASKSNNETPKGKYLVSFVEDSLLTKTVTEQDSVTPCPMSTMLSDPSHQCHDHH